LGKYWNDVIKIISIFEQKNKTMNEEQELKEKLAKIEQEKQAQCEKELNEVLAKYGYSVGFQVNMILTSVKN